MHRVSRGRVLWARLLDPARGVGRKIGAQRGARGVKNTHRGFLGGPQTVKVKNRTYDQGIKNLGLRKYFEKFRKVSNFAQWLLANYRQ